MVPTEDGHVVALIPHDNKVTISLDLNQSPVGLGRTLLHAMAHLALGHVRPGDTWGHWDTPHTVQATTPHRTWDQQVKTYLEQVLPAAAAVQIESLEQCSALQKAQLGLWRTIGDMLGESLRLHPSAERYQQAAYQRQAAQRLVSMLEEFGGAMLCDGVGLGKTYVATTAMVHYANVWREAQALRADRLLEDPFRMTVIAPHSVVSTWRREAMPGLAAFGVPLASVRVISHAQLSRMVRASQLLEAPRVGLSDMEHLLLSDLVIVDEAHNFRSLAARRTKVLRDLLRLQPRREQRRRVLLLTATPINNSLEDLRQEVSLLFSRPLWLSDAKTDDGYRRQAYEEIQKRCSKARASKSKGDVAPLIVHGQAEAPFSDTIEFRDDLDFGQNVQRIGDYLKEQDKRLRALQDLIRARAQSGQVEPAQDGNTSRTQVRIAEDLLDRIVVQRSRNLCKEIERQQSSTVELLFRPDASAPEKLRYSDEYDGIQDVLAGFLPLFDTNGHSGAGALSLKVYMWADVREGVKTADDTASVVGLQRILVLKRLESSPVSFLITLLRLAVLHAHRLQQLLKLCDAVGDRGRADMLRSVIDELLAVRGVQGLAKVRSLATGERAPEDAGAGFLQSLSAAYAEGRPAADTDDPPPQMSLFGTEEDDPQREVLDRLWPLGEHILSDLGVLLDVTPGLADIVFGKFEQSQWPHRFIAGGAQIDWPASAAWGLRVVSDAKIRQLMARLIVARRGGQKVVVSSQFSDTVAYIHSVLRACRQFSHTDWQMVVRGLGVPHLHKDELAALLACTSEITGATEDRDELVNAFAPFYRVGPFRPKSGDGDGERRILDDAWESSWTGAILRPVDVLLATDVLAEGVNLQDAALMINYDVHWNPVRMIQRAGRIDRRLNPRIEHAQAFPDLEALAARLGQPTPAYYWHQHTGEPPVTVNMILPDELENELLLRERISTKTLAIDFTLGLDQGTGAESDWMASYKYQGIAGLNSLQKDRAIERVAGYHERLRQGLTAVGINTDWCEQWNGWVREAGCASDSPLLGSVRFDLRAGEPRSFSRYLSPTHRDDVDHWLWTSTKPAPSLVNFWIGLDGKTFPPSIRTDIDYRDDASRPVTAEDLLAAATALIDSEPQLVELDDEQVGWPLLQGATAVAAGFLQQPADRAEVPQTLRAYRFLQLKCFSPDTTQNKESS